MRRVRIFISSVQKEFADTRAFLRDYIDMIERCKSAGLKQLEFSVDAGFFILTVWRKRAGVDLEPGRHQVGTKLTYCVSV